MIWGIEEIVGREGGFFMKKAFLTHLEPRWRLEDFFECLWLEEREEGLLASCSRKTWLPSSMRGVEGAGVA